MRSILLSALLVCLPIGAAGQTRGVHVETGVQVGKAFGIEGPSFSPWRVFSEFGYMAEGTPGEEGRAWGGGGTLIVSVGVEDALVGIKPRVRYRFHPEWAVDVSAGLTFVGAEAEPGVSDVGFLGGVHLNYRSWLTFRTEVNVRETVPKNWNWDPSVEPEQGYETSVYAGLALRNTAGWVATGVGVAIFAGLMLAFLSAGAT
jgi:hypothetical protein